jgi:hypothetical protein
MLTVVSPTVCRKDATPSAAPRIGACIFITSTPIRKAGGPWSPGAKAITTNSLSWDTLNPIDGGPMLATYKVTKEEESGRGREIMHDYETEKRQKGEKGDTCAR